ARVRGRAVRPPAGHDRLRRGARARSGRLDRLRLHAPASPRERRRRAGRGDLVRRRTSLTAPEAGHMVGVQSERTLQKEGQSMSVAVTRPMTGAEYVESLKDDRQIYIHGQKVDDVTNHPAFRNAVRMIARLYDALHDPEHKDALTTGTDTGNGGFTHPFFK